MIGPGTLKSKYKVLDSIAGSTYIGPMSDWDGAIDYEARGGSEQECRDCRETFVSREVQERCDECAEEHAAQDPRIP